MSNPWMKKNPWLSLWLSGANAVAGAARGHAAAQAQAQARRTATALTTDVMQAWSALLLPTASTGTRRRRRR